VATEPKLDARNWTGLVEAALEISRKRHDILERMRAAFESGNDAEALKLGKELCGLTN
jgi:hypothetical protein